MAETKIFPKGIIAFAPTPTAPDWVLGEVIINLVEFNEWIKEHPQLITAYKNQLQLRLSLTRGKENRPSFHVNTFKPKEKAIPYKETEDARANTGETTEEWLAKESPLVVKEDFGKREVVKENNEDDDLPF